MAGVIGMTDKPEAAGQGQAFGQHLDQFRGKGHGEVMHHPDPCPGAQKLGLDRHGIGGDIGGGMAEFAQIIQFLVKDHVGDIADHPVVFQICQRPDRWVAFQITTRGCQMQLVFCQLLHRQFACLRPADGNGHVCFTL